MEEIAVGSIIEGIVTGIEDYGIFVKLNDKYSGLIHISEVTNGFVADINRYANIGEKIYVEVINVDEQNGKCILSIKDINYRIANSNSLIKESLKGFSPLKHHLQGWIDDKISELHENDHNDL